MNIVFEKLRSAIRYNTAIKISLALFGIFSLFHFGIIIGILVFNFVPIDFLWGGRMQNKEELLVFEIISFFIQVFCVWIVFVKNKQIQKGHSNNFVNAIIWVLCFVFFLNTIGNILAKSNFEKGFIIITSFLFILLLRIGVEKQKRVE